MHRSFANSCSKFKTTKYSITIAKYILRHDELVEPLLVEQIHEGKCAQNTLQRQSSM